MPSSVMIPAGGYHLFMKQNKTKQTLCQGIPRIMTGIRLKNGADNFLKTRKRGGTKAFYGVSFLPLKY